MMAVHLGSTFRLTRACCHCSTSRAGAGVINVTSYPELRGNIGQANYSAAKAGILGFTKAVADELAAFGFTVNAPSSNAATRMGESIPQGLRAQLESQIPLGRFAALTEMHGAVAFLASEGASYITGVVLPTDGGLSL